MSRILPLAAVCFFILCAECAATQVFIVGHRNPDTDSVAAAVSVAYLYKEWKGVEAIPCVQGKISPETAFALDKFKIRTPLLLTNANGKYVILVDHSDKEQAPDNVEENLLLGIFDHHKLGGLSTIAPPEIWIRPVGSTCTVVKELYDFTKQAIPPDIAGLMLCAILSDTLVFHSPTTTPDDRLAAAALAQLAGVSDIATLGAELLSAKALIANLSPEGIILQDFKDFNIEGHIVGIGQIELADASILTAKIPALLAQCQVMHASTGRHSVIFAVTDVTRSGSQLLVASDDISIIEKAFATKLDERTAWLDGVVSRKQQLVPALEKAFKETH
jgi:manganese-dependent inorganic pyrophosphatase